MQIGLKTSDEKENASPLMKRAQPGKMPLKPNE
jgi:hypothetical protein